MDSSSNIKAHNKISKSVHDIDEHNEFMSILANSSRMKKQRVIDLNNVHVKHQKQVKLFQENHSVVRRSYFNLVDPNKSVRQILKEMKQKQQSRREKILEHERMIQEEKVYQRKARQFFIAEKKIKNRIAVEQKMQEKKKRDIIIKQAIANNDSLKQIRKASKQKVLQSKVNSEKSRIKVRSSISVKVSPQKSLLQTIQQPQQQPQKIKDLKKSRRVLVGTKGRSVRVSTLPEDVSRDARLNKKIDYLRSLPRRKGKSIQRQLQTLMNNESTDSIDKAVELTEKLENKHRLRLKNINQKDYKQAQQKIKLLNFFYSIQSD